MMRTIILTSISMKKIWTALTEFASNAIEKSNRKSREDPRDFYVTMKQMFAAVLLKPVNSD
jgi:hypothetical protein